MITGKTKSGFPFKVKKDTLDDYELFEILCELDRGDYSKLPEMVRLLLGREQLEKLKAHIKGKEGKVSVTGMMNEVQEILRSNDETKN